MNQREAAFMHQITREMRESWKILAGLSILFAALGTSYTFTREKIYWTKTVLAPIGSNAISGEIAAGLSGLTGMAIGGGEQDELTYGLLTSRFLISAFLSSNPTSISSFSNCERYKNDSGGVQHDQARLVSCVMKSYIKISKDRKSGLVTLSVGGRNPTEAVANTQRYVDLHQTEMRNRTRMEAVAAIDSYGIELNTTTQIEIRDALFNLIQAELKKKAIASGGGSIGYTVVDPPYQDPSWYTPNLTKITVASLLSAIFVWFGLVFIGAARKSTTAAVEGQDSLT
jgi:hypothetical protein